MADETMVKGVAGQGHPTKDQNPLDSDRLKAKEKEKLLKEKILDEKMKLIRKKNEERLRRQREIEEDIKNASLHSNQVTEEKGAMTEHQMAGVQRDSSSTTRMRGRARGRILAKMAKEELQAHRFKNKSKQNSEDVENELQQEKLKDSSPTGTSSFLSNDRRVDMSKVPSRSAHSWGGSQFEDVVEKVNKEKHSRPKRENQNIEVSMTGKERKEYLEWKEERNRIDRERKFRQKSGENWKREWDREKANREVHSTHERRDQHHPRSGQRFGERMRKKPDWDLHDDRVLEKDVHHKENNEDEKVKWEHRNDQKNSIASHDKVEDWDDSSTASLERQSGSGLKEVFSSTNVQDSTTTSLKEIDDSKTNNETINTTTINSDISVGCHMTDKVDSKELEETARLRKNHEEATKGIGIRNLTVTIDSKGKRNISDEPTNNNINSHPDEMKISTVSDNKDESNEEAAIVEHDVTIEQPKPQRIHKKQRHRKGKDTQDSKDQENMVENDQTERSEITIPAAKNTADQEAGSDSTTNSTSSHLEKAKDTLPKLEIKREEENTQVALDFLKTPQKKNWADCEFDEELDLPPLEWGSLSK